MATQTVTSIGYGDLEPATDNERVYVPEWELQLRSPDGGVRGSDAGSSGTPGVGGVVERLRVGKRYHGTTEDHENFTPDRHVGERRVRRALRVVNDDR